MFNCNPGLGLVARAVEGKLVQKMGGRGQMEEGQKEKEAAVVGSCAL